MTAKLSLLLMVAAVWMSTPSSLTAATTPKPGSPERTAICDALRLYVQYSQQLPPQKADFKWKVESMKVEGKYASFEGRPFEAEGKLNQFFIDQDHCFLLQKDKNGTWKVLYDLSRTDVPGPEELAHIKKAIPKDFPSEILPPYWRKALTQ